MRRKPVEIDRREAEGEEERERERRRERRHSGLGKDGDQPPATTSQTERAETANGKGGKQ
ncbi:MAG: hypothetical protein E6474_06815 [Actinomyces sp.]|nr:hypothetical protein [Actinomyces sp.]